MSVVKENAPGRGCFIFHMPRINDGDVTPREESNTSWLSRCILIEVQIKKVTGDQKGNNEPREQDSPAD